LFESSPSVAFGSQSKAMYGAPLIPIEDSIGVPDIVGESHSALCSRAIPMDIAIFM
jgi:hypothetical protein